MIADFPQALQDFLLAALSLATILITAVVIPQARAHFGASRFQTAAAIATAAVRAIQQMYPDAANEQKLMWAVTRARELAAAKGIRLRDDQWETLLEQAVHDMKQIQQAIEPVATSQVQPRDEHGRFVKRATA